MKKFLKTVFVASFVTLAAPSVAAAEVRYVTEDLSTYLRRGAGDDYRIAGSIKSGEKVTVLSQKDKYSQIRDSRNREAWILTSELSSEASSKELIPTLKNQIQELTLKLNRIDEEWQQRVSEMQRRSRQAESQSSQLLEQNSQLKRQLDISSNKNREYEALLSAEKQEIIIRWFIYGGSVMLVGLLLGLILPNIIPRRRRRDGWS
ncbi:SH3 domain-containing protein [Testudinibacter sp. TR-2022]|uniref:TIGR04211 family SH3 domain-containing protein n=1 Tax=Testudinibacter sp. TR-2022 TaxID=2585029 RepID=UPI0011192C1C|nr:TIGR04211 family SH3 domain-containing protein [Testudinibacter sp. TR-2022]TNH05630.1 SH3 domain-containing protein [Pasteurellaceae bacterium Phil31]TNH10004.1 SH3 domain-containing protein [Testudinibacter sp. TR-2022]TNH12250.1 SH3 domain-containing protein [Testudinibacter sp. TR-2022]TNH14065.1 SH3 domain-containing protein [Testudinibacter sp. TR-2022]TNH19297.1 SH3 domain-containing protein [Testudinibacter sp. TR-2022]